MSDGVKYTTVAVDKHNDRNRILSQDTPTVYIYETVNANIKYCIIFIIYDM